MTIDIRVLRPGDDTVLGNVASELFDKPVDLHAARAFLADPRHHIAVAIDGRVVVGFASGVHYFHPDKPAPELFVNEVGVAPTHQGRGIGKSVLGALLQRGRELGCVEAWVLTERSNPAAMRLYSACGAEEPTEHVMFSFRIDAAPPAERHALRKQYYFRPSDRGLLAWDVDQLVKLSAGLPRRHRIAKAVRAGYVEIEAVQFKVDPPPDHVGKGPDELPY